MVCNPLIRAISFLLFCCIFHSFDLSPCVFAGYITVKTTSLAGDCVVAKMAKLVEEAQSSKTKSQRLIDKCAQYYTPGKQKA